MRSIRLLKLAFPLLVLVAALAGVLVPNRAEAALGVCNYFCLDPGLTCCITCHWRGGSCVCPDFCTIEPEL